MRTRALVELLRRSSRREASIQSGTEKEQYLQPAV
jgi:hypothetical protein